METKSPKNDVPSSMRAAKKPYEAPVLKDWGTLKDITLSQSSGRKADGGNRRGQQSTN